MKQWLVRVNFGRDWYLEKTGKVYPLIGFTSEQGVEYLLVMYDGRLARIRKDDGELVSQ